MNQTQELLVFRQILADHENRTRELEQIATAQAKVIEKLCRDFGKFKRDQEKHD